jgi:hypothetical protein
MENREKLRAKLRKKREHRKNGTHEPPVDPFNGEMDLMKMMESVNKILKSQPQMVQKISKCVSNVMNNKELMDSLANQLETQVTLESNSEEVSREASPKESIQ